jgi:hypothetical protein
VLELELKILHDFAVTGSVAQQFIDSPADSKQWFVAHTLLVFIELFSLLTYLSLKVLVFRYRSKGFQLLRDFIGRRTLLNRHFSFF